MQKNAPEIWLNSGVELVLSPNLHLHEAAYMQFRASQRRDNCSHVNWELSVLGNTFTVSLHEYEVLHPSLHARLRTPVYTRRAIIFTHGGSRSDSIYCTLGCRESSPIDK